ncbi:uncharacterized protein LOC106652986 [Trichogramma pretiosum]|uniref:uncharacterized protein LOC106652986 n=1 Tax=Trichogramma pretiosum TaxID=7493 RepID=UPI0006C9785A|nr:uncharacterized protein LOC106652986 [Trichogramma pretiosum]
MFLILRLFNSILFVLANVSIAFYTMQRFFRVMRTHYQLVDEVEDFSFLVNQARASLDFVGNKILESMKDMEADIGREVYVTHNLTKLSTKTAALLRRFSELEENIIELARLSYNMDNAMVETPADVNEEVRRIFKALKQKNATVDSHHNNNHHSHHQSQSHQQIPSDAPSSRIRARSAPAKKERSSRSHGNIETAAAGQHGSSSHLPQPVSKFSTTQARARSSPRTTTTTSANPPVVPEVTLLVEAPPNLNSFDKPIGFRPPWMCQV